MSAWSNARPIRFTRAKDGGLVADEFPAYATFPDAFLATAATRPAGKDEPIPPVLLKDGYLVLHCTAGTAAYRLHGRNGDAGETLAQLIGPPGWEP